MGGFKPRDGAESVSSLAETRGRSEGSAERVAQEEWLINLPPVLSAQRSNRADEAREMLRQRTVLLWNERRPRALQAVDFFPEGVQNLQPWAPVPAFVSVVHCNVE